MRALAGIFNIDQRPAERALLQRMLDAACIAPHAPAKAWLGGAAALGARTLPIIPGAQDEVHPWSTPGGDLRILFDGRLDNRSELIEALGLCAGGDPTDAALACLCYERWGDGAWNRLYGDFALILRDEREQRMVCARDPFGMRPLHYHFDGKTLLCATDLIQILQDSRIARTPNDAFLAEYMAGGPFSRTETVIRNVLRLEAGSFLICDRNGTSIRRYFDLAAARPIRFPSFDDCIAALREVLIDAVRSRMRTAAPVASHLSGGLDSSSIVLIASDLIARGAVDQRLEALSLVFSDPEADEREYIAEVERAHNFTSHQLPPFEPDAAYYADYARRTFELPRHPNSVMFESADHALVSLGSRVCLTGHGGDHCLNGHPRDLAHLLRDGRPISFMRAVWSLKATAAAGELDDGAVKTALRCGAWPFVPRHLQALVRRTLGIPADDLDDVFFGWLNRDFVRQTGLAERLRGSRAEYDEPEESLRNINYLMRDGWTTYGVEGEARGAALLGFEYWRPFCDRRLAEFLAGLDPEQRWNRGRTKFLLRQAMRGILPEKIRQRRNKGLFDPIYMRVLKKLGVQLGDSLIVADRGLIDASRFREAYSLMWRLFEARDHQRYPDFFWAMFSLLGLELWMRQLSSFRSGRTQAADLQTEARNYVADSR